MNGNTLKQTCHCNPFNSFITSKIHEIPLQGWSWACHTNNPLGVEIVTILVPFIFESNQLALPSTTLSSMPAYWNTMQWCFPKNILEWSTVIQIKQCCVVNQFIVLWIQQGLPTHCFYQLYFLVSGFQCLHIKSKCIYSNRVFI